MPVTLTSTGIQFSDGTVATYDTSLKPVAVATNFSGASSYTFSNISASMKRLELQMYLTNPVTGPTYAAVNLASSNGTFSSFNSTNIYAGSQLNILTNQTDIFNNGNNYRSIPITVCIIEYIGTNPIGYPAYSVQWQAWNSRTTLGFGSVVSGLGTGKLSSITLLPGPNFANFTGALYVEI